jgi:hypothetical protein
VDGARGAYALWQAEEDFARLACAYLGKEYEENLIIQGATVKTNEDVFQDIQTYVRQDSGLLTYKHQQRAKEMRLRLDAGLEETKEMAVMPEEDPEDEDDKNQD